MNYIIRVSILLLILCFFASSCTPVQPAGPVVYRYTFEPETPIAAWLTDGHVTAVTENSASAGSLAVEGTIVKTGAGSLKVSATLPSGTTIYTSCAAFFNLNETLATGASLDCSQKSIAASFYSPAAPVGGGDYIQITLKNANGSVLVSKSFSAITPDGWTDVAMDVPDYIIGTQVWGYKNLAGTDDSDDDVYRHVTQIGFKIGFQNGPNRTYEYYLDDISITDSSVQLSLHYLADLKGEKLGAAVVPGLLSEAAYANTLKAEFNTVVGENCMKWTGLHTADNTYNYSDADTLVAFAQANSMYVRGHCLLWHHPSQRPAWLETKAASYDGSAGSALEAELEEHINAVITHFGNKVYAWDVVNEVLIDPWSSPAPDYVNTKGLRNKTRAAGDYTNSFWAVDANDDYLLKRAFAIADAKLTELGYRNQVKLFACDYTNEEMGTAKANQFFKLVQGWVADGVQIDGVAFQLHLSQQYAMPNPTAIRNNINRFKALKPGFEVHFSEIDIAIDSTGGVSDAELAAQATTYGNLMAICREYPEVTSFLTWGVTDKYSWLSANQYTQGLIYDNNYLPKPCYYTIRQELCGP
jgi:endo-1,4-beta-xylanase